jgi:predicted  nucleic acid-binding Zn-ribbon protein
MAAAAASYAQAPVEDARQRQDTLQRDQQRAGAAYRALRQAEFETKQAAEDNRRADAEYRNAQKRTDELKGQADAASKKFDAARAREAQARKAYDAAVNAVGQTPPPAPTK